MSEDSDPKINPNKPDHPKPGKDNPSIPRKFPVPPNAPDRTPIEVPPNEPKEPPVKEPEKPKKNVPRA